MRVPGRLSDFARTLQLRRRSVAAISVVLLMGAGASCMSTTALKHEAIAMDDAVALDVSPRVIPSSVKAHLADGSTVLFPEGVTIEEARVTGNGDRYDIRLSPVGSVSEIARDSVVALERFATVIDGDKTIAYNALSTLFGLAAGAVVLLMAR
ncbi:MAG: hypothetical protein F4151_02490 [Gammaproteobacteria bacterium]|nr:hypothetical protein [Gammaproteobacteria bacterium]